MFSTSSKIAFGYLLLIVLLFGTIGYIYQQMTLLMAPNGLEETIVNRRRTTHQIVTQLYEAEIIGQTLRTGRLGDYPIYQRAMRRQELPSTRSVSCSVIRCNKPVWIRSVNCCATRNGI